MTSDDDEGNLVDDDHDMLLSVLLLLLMMECHLVVIHVMINQRQYRMFEDVC